MNASSPSRLLTILALPLASVLALAASGCAIYSGSDDAPEPSAPAPLLTVAASAIGDGVTVVEVCVQRGAPVCEPYGELVVESDGQRISLPYRQEPRYQIHRGELDGDQDGKEIVVAYTNAEAGVDAPASRMTLPAAPAPITPEEGSAVAIGEDVRVTWEPGPAGDRITWGHRGTCTGAAERSWDKAGAAVEGDPGEVLLAADAMGVAEGETCAVEVEIVRSREGEADPALTRALLVAAQARTVRFTVGP